MLLVVAKVGEGGRTKFPHQVRDEHKTGTRWAYGPIEGK